MEKERRGDRNWPVLVFVVFFSGLILLNVSLLIWGTLDETSWIFIVGGLPLWAVLLVWMTRIFIISRRFYCATPACALRGRSSVFLPKGGQWICTQCSRPLTVQALTHPQPLQSLVGAASYSGSLGDTFLGGVAGLRIYRFKGRGQVNIVSGWRNPWGYGIYLTDKNLVGISYTKYLSRAYYPGWVLSIVWIAILALTFAWFAVTHTGELPIWWIPIFPISFFGVAIMALVFLLYLSPKRASSQIDRIQVNSIRDLESLRTDVVLRRDDISEINFRGTKVYEFHGTSSRGAIVSISLKRGPPVVFVTTKREKFSELVELVQDFAEEEEPPIKMTEN